MRLRMVARKSFVYSEATLFEMVEKESDPLRLGKDDVVAVVSLAGDQILFIFGWRSIDEAGGTSERRCLRSQRYRLDRGSWNPLMLKNYASEVGIELDGLRRFEDYYADDALKEKAQAQAQAGRKTQAS